MTLAELLAPPPVFRHGLWRRSLPAKNSAPRGTGLTLPPPNLMSTETRDAWLHYLAARPITHFVTLTTNEPCDAQKMYHKIAHWHSMTNRQLLGTRWLKKPDEFFISFSFPELIDVNAHWHCLVELLEDQFSNFDALAEDVWLKLAPSGTVKVDVIGNTREDRRRVERYAAKRLRLIKNYQTIHVGKFVPKV